MTQKNKKNPKLNNFNSDDSENANVTDESSNSEDEMLSRIKKQKHHHVVAEVKNSGEMNQRLKNMQITSNEKKIEGKSRKNFL